MVSRKSETLKVKVELDHDQVHRITTRLNEATQLMELLSKQTADLVVTFHSLLDSLHNLEIEEGHEDPELPV